MANFSTGCRDAMMGTVGLKGALTNFIVQIWSGSIPATADAAATGTLLGTFTLNGDGSTPLNLLAPVSGVTAKDPTVVWRATGVAAGTAGYARFKLPADVAGLSTTAYRVDVQVATSGAELNLNSLTFAVGSPHSVDAFNFNN